MLGGDFVTDFDQRYAEPCAELLAKLTAPHGVYAVLGNHDDDREVPRALTARSFEVLKDARTRVVIGGDALELVGVGFWTRRSVALTRLLEGARDTTILLAHDPATVLRRRGARYRSGPVRTYARRPGRAARRRRAVRDRASPSCTASRDDTTRRSSSVAAWGRSTYRCGSIARRKSP